MSIEIDPDEPLRPRSDFWSALVWIVFGAAITVGAWRMDRLEHLHINKYEIPGLVPGLLGFAMLVLGAVLALRAVARGALREVPPGASHEKLPGAFHTAAGGVIPGGAGTGPSAARTMTLVFALTLFYALALVGHGVPFWLGTLAFVTTFIFIFDRERQSAMQRSTMKQAALALLYGVATSAIVSYAFEKIFLVRLP